MSQRNSPLGTFLLIMALCSLIAITVMIFGAHLGLWQPIVSFGYIRNYMNPVAYTVLGLGIAGLIYYKVTHNRIGALKALTTSLIGLCLLAPMIYSSFQVAKPAPPIHDITTDTENPPRFLVLDENRAGAKNSLIYAGAKDAAIQKKAYPDIAPIQSKLSASAVFNIALKTAREMNWEIVSEDAKALRFEASATTLIYRFVDDVVVLVTPKGNASRIDIRSVSRIGRSDRGVNAERIRDFTRTFNNLEK